MNNLEIEYWNLNQIKPYPNNAKNHPESHVNQISNSIEEFSFLDPVAVDEDGVLLEGHGRLMAAERRGLKTIPVIQVKGLSEAQKIAYRLAHNKLTINSGFDVEMLKFEFEQLKEFEFDLSLTGFDFEEIDLGGDPFVEAREKTYKGDRPLDARVEFGQIWQLGRHILCCGDSTDSNTVEQLIKGHSVELVWSDPPYGMNCQNKDGVIGRGRKYATIAGDNSTEIAIASFTLCQELFPKTAQIWWGGNHYAEILPNSPCWIVWDKLNGDNNFADCELAWTNLDGAVRKFAWQWQGMIKQGEAANQKRIHPNQKPVEMVVWFWDKYCSDAKICFDPFLGSGTSIIAAEKTDDRVVIGCEFLPEYCDVILTRWEEVSGSKAVLIEKR